MLFLFRVRVAAAFARAALAAVGDFRRGSKCFAGWRTDNLVCPDRQPVLHRSVQSQACGSLQIARIVEQNPLNDRKRQRAIGDQIVMKLSEAEGSAFGVAVTA